MKSSKKLLSAILSITMLTTTIATISASADYTIEEKTQPIVSEDFNKLTISEDKQYTTDTAKLGDYTYYRNNGGNNGQKFSVTDGKLVMDVQGNDGNIIYFKPFEAVSLESGDALHINFDISASISYANPYVAIQLGDNLSKDREDKLGAGNESGTGTYKLPNYRYENISGTKNVNNDNKSAQPYSGTYNSVASFNSSGMQFGNFVTGSGLKAADNVNVDIVINPYDEVNGNEQTIKTTFSSGSKTVTNYSYLDADYTGTDDNTFSKISDFEYLRFYVSMGSATFTMSLDNMLIEKVQTSKKYYKASGVKSLLKNYSFDDVELNNVSVPETDTALKTIDAANNVYFSQFFDTASVYSVKKDADLGKNVFKQSISNNNGKDKANYLTFKNPNGKTDINPGDIIRFSYKMKIESADSGVVLHTSPTLNSPRYNPYIVSAKKDGDGKYQYGEYNNGEYNMYYINTYNDEEYKNGNIEEGIDEGRYAKQNVYGAQGMLLEAMNGSNLRPYCNNSYSSRWSGCYTLSSNDWHTFDFIINTADKAMNGKQTMKVYVDKGTDKEYVMYKSLDIVNTIGRYNESGVTFAPDENDIYDHLSSLEMQYTVEKNKDVSASAIYTTDYSLDIITPSFGIRGEAIENNDPTDGINLTPGKMTVECVLNVPGNGEEHEYTLYAAQYSGDALVDITVEKKVFTDYNYKQNFDVDVKDNADSLKLFAFDNDLTPLVVNEIATVDGATSARAISYTLANSDMH